MSHDQRYRSIDVSGLPSAALAERAAPQLLWVEIDKLVIDARYQRPLERANIAAICRIAAEFKWSRFSTVLVAPIEGGRFAVIDGQHRVHAAKLCGISEVPAMSVLVPPAEQALAFVEINTRQIKVTQHQVYRAALVAGEPWAIACRDAVAGAGCELMARNNIRRADKKPRQVFAIGLVRQLVHAGDGWAVTAGLRALTAIDKGADVALYDSLLLTPLLQAVAATQEARGLDLSAFLARVKPWLVLEIAERLAAQEGRPVQNVRREAFCALLRKFAEEQTQTAAA